MARVAGRDLPKEKHIDIALSYIYGVGRPLARVILAEANIDPSKLVKDLTENEVGVLNTIIAKQYKVEGDLRRDISQNVRRLIDIGCYRGIRHRRGLPCRGQRTRTNARTKRGKRKTVGSSGTVKKEQPAKG